MNVCWVCICVKGLLKRLKKANSYYPKIPRRDGSFEADIVSSSLCYCPNIIWILLQPSWACSIQWSWLVSAKLSDYFISSQCCLQTFYADIVLPCCVERHLFLQALQLQVSCHRWCSIIGVTLMMVWGSMIRFITTTVWPGLSIHWIKMRQPCFEYSLMVCKTGFLQPTRHTLLGTSQARTDLLTHLTDLTFDRLPSWHSCQDSNYPICCNHSNGRIFLPRGDRHLPSNLQDGRHQEK